MRKGSQHGCRNQFFMEKLILRETCVYYCKSMVLEVPGVPKAMQSQSKNDAKTSFEKGDAKNMKMMLK